MVCKYRVLFAAVGGAALCSVIAGAPALAHLPDQPKAVFMFSPVAMTVTARSTVTWATTADEPHAVMSEGFSFKLDKPGT